MFQDAFAGLERQIQTREIGMAFLELIDDPQRLKIVFEPPEFTHTGIQRFLAGVAEGRMTQIMSETDGLHEILVEAHGASDGSRDLCDLQRMRQPRPIKVAFVIDENLGLIHEATKRGGMNDSIAVALKLATIRGRRLGMTAALGIGRADGIRSEVCGHDTPGSG